MDPISLPWQQGRTLDTEQTRRWSRQVLEMNELSERKRIFVNFSSEDEGRSRLFVMECPTAEIAKHVVEVHNEWLAAQRS